MGQWERAMTAAFALTTAHAVLPACNARVSTDTSAPGDASVATAPADAAAAPELPPPLLEPSTHPCNLQSFDVTGARDATLETGPVVIRGVVLVRKPVARIEIAAAIGPPHWVWGTMAVARGTFDPPRAEISFELRGLPLSPNPEKGGYLVRAFADEKGDGHLDDGDIAGFYAGTVLAPALPHEAQDVGVGAAAPETCSVVFGIGFIACPGAWGSACSSDAECAPTVCECKDGLKSYSPKDSCDPVTKTCRRVPYVDCAPNCGGAANVIADRPGDCTGQ